MKVVSILLSRTTPRSCPQFLFSNHKRAQHKRYQNNEHRFNLALCQAISLRKIDIRAKDLYNEAGVTAPTFYAHYRNSNDARQHYELVLEQELSDCIPESAHKNLILTILPNFIAHNHHYFLAVHKSRDHYWLTKVIIKYRINLVGEKISDRSFYIYVGSVEATIACWLELDELNKDTIARCVQDLIRLRVPTA